MYLTMTVYLEDQTSKSSFIELCTATFSLTKMRSGTLLSVCKMLKKKEIAIIFFNNIEDCELLCETFKLLNIKCGSLHSYK